MRVLLVSFGYKHGGPSQADFSFDVRFLPNPFYEKELKKLTGKNGKVKRFVASHPATRGFLRHTEGLLTLLFREYKKRGKGGLTLAFGCTGGRHRSVAIVEILRAWLVQNKIPVKVCHRDLK